MWTAVNTPGISGDKVNCGGWGEGTADRDKRKEQWGEGLSTNEITDSLAGLQILFSIQLHVMSKLLSKPFLRSLSLHYEIIRFYFFQLRWKTKWPHQDIWMSPQHFSFREVGCASYDAPSDVLDRYNSWYLQLRASMFFVILHVLIF
jgi:hypothetical protein